MPFELGLTVAYARMTNRNHRWVMLEEVRFRLQKSLSDMNGYDPFVHRGTVKGMFHALCDAFESPDQNVARVRMNEVYKHLRVFVSKLKADRGSHDIFRASAFRELIDAAQTIKSRLDAESLNG